ncbi:MAG TPA: outer membrane lipoprotein-sorting protein [Myxococcota bacterium]|nr:outer membrane lipoprotein-sorting protein [Myxococcota bacterium]
MSSAPGFRALFAPCAAGLLAAAAGFARAQGSIEEVADCAIRNLPPSAHAHAKLTTRAKGGAETAIDVEFWSSTSAEGTRKVAVVQRGGPASGFTGYLVSDGDAIGEAWAVSKKDGKARKIEERGARARMFATNLSLEDFARFGRVVFPGQVRRRPDGEIDGRKTFVVETKPAPDAGSEYSRIVTSIDREWCLILRREGYEAGFDKGAKPRKVYQVAPADVKVQDKFANGMRGRMDDAKDGSSTELQVVDLEVPAKVDESFFTPASLERAAH